jgi:hypothetical protein
VVGVKGGYRLHWYNRSVRQRLSICQLSFPSAWSVRPISRGPLWAPHASSIGRSLKWINKKHGLAFAQVDVSSSSEIYSRIFMSNVSKFPDPADLDAKRQQVIYLIFSPLKDTDSCTLTTNPDISGETKKEGSLKISIEAEENGICRYRCQLGYKTRRARTTAN